VQPAAFNLGEGAVHGPGIGRDADD